MDKCMQNRVIQTQCLLESYTNAGGSSHKAVAAAQRYPCPLHGCPPLGPTPQYLGLNHFRTSHYVTHPSSRDSFHCPPPSVLTFFNPLLSTVGLTYSKLALAHCPALTTPFLLSHKKKGTAGERPQLLFQGTCFFLFLKFFFFLFFF